jgi:hypothetical protein
MERPAMEAQTIEVLKARFLAKVDQTGDCWIWKGTINGKGYGSCTGMFPGECNSHRVAYRLFHGDIPAGHLVLHSCDTRCCVNPKHLSVGTHARNTAEMILRGGHNATRGERNGNAILTESQVVAIHLAAKYGVPPRFLADIGKCDGSTVAKILSGHRWPDVWERFNEGKAPGQWYERTEAVSAAIAELKST